MTGIAPAVDGADDEGVVRSSMGLFPDSCSPAGSGDAVGQLGARVKARAMRWATRCCEMHLLHLGTLAAALLTLAVPDARAGDTNAMEAAPQQVAACTRAASFRMIVDVGHGTQAPGALSARGVDEYVFNLRLAQMTEEKRRAAGCEKTTLMVTPDKPSRGLFKRVTRANASKADLFLSVHHDSVPDKMLENWQVDGHAQHYNDRFPGHSIFISNTNADRAGSLVFARQLGLALK